MSNPVILFVNHRERSCGVQQFGKRLFTPALSSKKYQNYYIDIEHESEFDHWAAQLNPEIVVYNYYNGATMPWLNRQKVDAQHKRFKQCSVFHEVDIWNMGFDHLIHQDPTNDDARYFNISRPIPDYTPVSWECEIPVIGSFGFGLGGKGFTRIIEYVKRDFDRAIVRFNIPYAAFGDKDGTGAHSWKVACQSLLHDAPQIKLQITHDLLEENDLLDWLAMNTINAFLYDENYGRGISGTLDYALAARKPIAITKSWQFKHFWTQSDKAVLDNCTFRDIIEQGTGYLDLYHTLWGNAAVLRDWDAIFDKIRGV